MTVSACMIVKNEEKNLRRSLQSLQGVADEIIVVDTGSTDRSAEIAREYQARVFFFPWIDDFAAARNFSIQKAVSDWILIIDADEELQPADPAYWQELMQAAEYEGYFVQIMNVLQTDGKPVIRNPALRLFRRREHYYYEGRIHEQILPQILHTQKLDAIGTARLELLHFGYGEEVIQEKQKIERNLHLLQMELKNNPKNFFARFNLGVEYMRSGKYLLASWHLRAALEGLDPSVSMYPYGLKRLGMSLTSAGELESSIKVLRDAIEKFPDYTDLYFDLGEVYMWKGDYPRAIRQFEQCLELGEPPFRYVSEKGVGGARAALMLGFCHEMRFEIEEAIRTYLGALQKEGAHPDLLQALGHVMIHYRKGWDVRPSLQEACSILPAEVLFAFLIRVYRVFTGEIRSLLEREPDLLPTPGRALLLARIAWKQRRFSECERLLESIGFTAAGILAYQLFFYLGNLEKCRSLKRSLSKAECDFCEEMEQSYKDQLYSASWVNRSDLWETNLPLVEEFLQNWIDIRFDPGIQSTLQIFQTCSLPKGNMLLGKLLFHAGYFQEAIHHFLQVEEDALDGESLQYMAEMASLGDDQITAIQFIHKASEREQNPDYHLAYLDILLKNVTGYMDKAIPLFPEHTALREVGAKLRKELNQSWPSSLFYPSV